MKDDFNSSRAEYLTRIHYVLDYIEANLESDLTLQQLSKEAHYSTYHFHRVFSTLIGETLNQYVNRKRIERIASTLLIDSNKSIKELAYTYGFNSESSFSRSFKKFYGISPTTFKSEGKHTLSKIGIDPFKSETYICSVDQIEKWIKMNAHIVVTELQEIKLAGIMHIGEFDEMSDMYRRLMEWGHKHSLFPASNFKAITIYHDNPNVTHHSNVRYSTCITIQRDIEPQGEIRPLTIQHGIYVVGRFEIKGEEISTAWKNMCIWVIENGYKFRDGEYFEIYHNNHKTHPELKFLLDICIPLEWADNIKLDNTHFETIFMTKQKDTTCEHRLNYHELILYMKELRLFFLKEHHIDYALGKINQGSSDYTYFSLTPAGLKKLKLKFVIILDHTLYNFVICLSGQNKSVRKNYWDIFYGSDWNKYHVADSIENNLMIVDHILLKNPNFQDTDLLTQQIEVESLTFMNELQEVLERI